MINMPIMNVKLVDINLLQANHYNPNNVAHPEMKLLELSIREDGYTQPIVTYEDLESNKYIIVDGFHRYTIGQRLQLKELPIVVIDKPLDNRIASTIRHNRARGSHSIDGMQEIMQILIKSGKSDKWITKHLGMGIDEVFRLKQLSGLAELFKDKEFSKSWEVEDNL